MTSVLNFFPTLPWSRPSRRRKSPRGSRRRKSPRGRAPRSAKRARGKTSRSPRITDLYPRKGVFVYFRKYAIICTYLTPTQTPYVQVLLIPRPKFVRPHHFLPREDGVFHLVRHAPQRAQDERDHGLDRPRGGQGVSKRKHRSSIPAGTRCARHFVMNPGARKNFLLY